MYTSVGQTESFELNAIPTNNSKSGPGAWAIFLNSWKAEWELGTQIQEIHVIVM